MREFFSLDGAFNKYGGFVADMIILSLMWILFSIPIITIGAATTAMFFVSTRRISNREGYITGDFWASFKANFKRATLLWLMILAIGGVLVFNLRHIDIVGDGIVRIIMPAQVVFLIALTFMTIYIFPITARFDMSFGQTLKSAFFMANRHFLTSIICAALILAAIFGSLLMPPVFFIAPGVYAMLTSFMFMRIFKKYRPEMDRDPALELAEIEAERAEARRRGGISTIESGGHIMLKTLSMRNKNGMALTVTNLGCAIISLVIPTKEKPTDVVLGFDHAEDYKKLHPSFGVVCGRVANRIGNGKFQLEGKTYQLEINHGIHHLHGGTQGFDKKVWTIESAQDNKIIFTLESPDGDSGYPAKLQARVTYTLSDENILRIDYAATADDTTICNMTNHSYFNLCGHDTPNIYEQTMQIFSDKITAVDDGLIPTGELMDIAGTPFDFTSPKPLGKDIEAAGKMNDTDGYDHNYVLRQSGTAAIAHSPTTGITMTVSTNSPGVQLYTANSIDGTLSGKGVTYQKHSAFCLETQYFPDAVNKPSFPSPIIRKGETQQAYTEFKFEW
ncbi:MAG: galactose-1-epimerase [Defluviitaleaceae bacterium]|nr:galactose-1-epimerase [Defluviitaleaceae bacterium]